MRAAPLTSVENPGACCKDRATSEEWRLVESSEQPDLLSLDGVTAANDATLNALNEALAHYDETAIMYALGVIARERGMSHIARETGLARESLYRSLDAKGNPEFTTVLKVLSSIGLRLEVKRGNSEAERPDSTAVTSWD